MKVQGMFKRRALTLVAVLSWMLQPSKFATPFSETITPPPCEPREQGQAPSMGAMDEMSQKVQNASTHILRRQSYEHAHNSRSVQVPVQGAIEELSQKVQNANTHMLRRRRSHEHAYNSRSVQGGDG